MRGCAAEISHNLGKTFEVTSFVKPGTGLEVITNTAKEEINKLTKEDVVIVCGGTNDIGKNASSNGLKPLSNFVESRKHTNIIIMSAPHRDDLITSSCVNSEVKVFNRKLHKQMKLFDHAALLDMKLNREHFTHHGLHMNTSGKTLISQRIAYNIRRIFIKRMTPPIILKWNSDPTESSEGKEVEGKRYFVMEQKERGTCSSGRLGKQPVTKNYDFLWPISLSKSVY